MQYEDDYKRRRAYVSRSRKYRKRQRMVRILIFFLVLGAVILAVGIGGYFLLQSRKKHNFLSSQSGDSQSGDPVSIADATTEETTTDDREARLTALLADV